MTSQQATGRRGQALFATLFGSLTLIASEAHAQAVEYCPPYGLLEQPTVDPGEGFLAFVLRIENVGVRKRVRVTGDRVRLNQATLGSLIKAAARTDPTVAEIVIDARQIDVEEGLAVSEGKLTLIADSVNFLPGGTLSLLPDDKASISITARTLSLPDDEFGQFDVRTPAASSSGAVALPGTQSLLSITGETLIIGGQAVAAANAVSVLNNHFTLHYLQDFSSRIAVALGTTGRSAWLDTLEHASEWPPYTAAVWTSAFSLNPFDEKSNRALRDNIARYAPVIERRPPKEDTQFLTTTLSAAISRGADLDGNGPAWATTLPLSERLEQIRAFADDRGDGLQTINQLIAMLEKVRDGTAPDTSALVTASEDKLNASIVEFDQTSVRLGEIQTDLAQRTAALGSMQQLYASREERLRQHAEDLKKSDELRSQIVSGLATAASIVATAYTGNPQTGAIAGGIVLAVGNMTGGKPAIQSLSDGYQFSVAMKTQLEGATAAVKSLKEARDEYKDFIRSAQLNNITIEEQIEVPIPDAKPGDPQTRTVKREDALKDVGKRGEALADAMKGIFDVYTKFKPEPAPVPAVIEEDGNLKEQAKAIASALDALKSVTLELDTLQRRSQALQTDIAGASEQLARLRTVDITNEEGRRSVISFSVAAIRGEMTTFVKTAMDVRRLSLVEYAEPLPIDPDQVIRVAVEDRTSPTWDPAAAKDQRELLAAYIDHLKARRDGIKLLAVRLRQTADNQFHSYVGRRGVGPIVGYPEQQITSSPKSPQAEKAFLLALNSTIQEQYALLKGRRSVSSMQKFEALRSRRISIPFALENALPVRFPVRLLDANVTEVKRGGSVSGGDLVLSVDVERVGNFKAVGRFSTSPAKQTPPAVAASCFSVDLRSKDSTPEQYFKTADYNIGDVDAGLTQPPRNDISFWYLNAADKPDTTRTMFVTYPPAAARMYMRVRLDPGASWRSSPVIQSVTIKLRVFE